MHRALPKPPPATTSASLLHPHRRPFASSLLIIALMAGTGLDTATANLIVNGSFEVPSTPNSIYTIVLGGEPAGFGWTVTKGEVETFDGLGYDFGYGQPYHGSQILDLNGVAVGGISQAFATTPGMSYQLTFAYANNWAATSPTDPATATVRIFDTGSGLDVVSPLAISHGTSAQSNLDWTLATLTFVPTGTSTTLDFDSTRYSTPTTGIFLDAVSVTPVPEPKSIAAASAASLAGLALVRRLRQGRGA
jgi:hypothetical protein